MNSTRSKAAVLDDEFLPLRARILELAAGLDRLDRAPGGAPNDARRTKLEAAVRLLIDGRDRRAERVQLLFSREYDPKWRDNGGSG